MNSAAGRHFSLQRNLQEVADSRELLEASTGINRIIITLISGQTNRFVCCALCLITVISASLRCFVFAVYDVLMLC